MAETFRVLEYTEASRSPFAEWFNQLDPVTAARVDRYIRRLEAGNFGAAKPLSGGVCELRLDFGPGYRIYYGLAGDDLILLAGGTKSSQAADIDKAKSFWMDYEERKRDAQKARLQSRPSGRFKK